MRNLGKKDAYALIQNLRAYGLTGTSKKALRRLALCWRSLILRLTAHQLDNLADSVADELKTPVRSFLAPKRQITTQFAQQPKLLEIAKLRSNTSRLHFQNGEVYVNGRGYLPIADEEHYQINRHDFVIWLCQDHVLVANSPSESLLIEYLESWLQDHSTLADFKRDKTLDIAFRLLNWVWVFTYLDLQHHVRLRQRLAASIVLQLHIVKSQLSPGGNHLVAEALACYVWGQILASNQSLRRFSVIGRRILTAEIVKQTSLDGAHLEQSTFYHAVVTTHFLKAALSAFRSKQDFGEQFRGRLEAMNDYFVCITKPDGSIPVIGDGGALNSPLDREHYESSVLLGHDRSEMSNDQARRTELSDDSSIWFFGTASCTESRRQQPITSRVFADAGIAVFRDKADYLLVNAGAFGDPEFSHHGHADALSIELCYEGVSLLVDGGGYNYEESQYRLFFRGTESHNTLLIDQQSQTDVFGIFGHGKRAVCKVNEYRTTSSYDFIDAQHDGYDDLVHRRQVYFLKRPIRATVIVDFVIAERQFSADHRLLLSPDVTWLEDDKAAKCESETVAYFHFFRGLDSITPSSYFGDPRPMGWSALSTNLLTPASQLSVTFQGSAPSAIVTIITPSSDDVTATATSSGTEYLFSGNAAKLVVSRESCFSVLQLEEILKHDSPTLSVS